MAVVANIAVNRIVVEKLFTFGAKGVVIIAAVITNINIIAILVDSKRNFVGKEVFVALITE